MCGIAGQISYKQSIDPERIRAMIQPLVHRGPDDEGIYISNSRSEIHNPQISVGLGHKRLSIIDLDGGHQPIHNEDKSVWIICNGEIYNYKELRGKLTSSGHTLYTNTDTEVIVHLYEDYGERCLDHLRGMFAFAIWDERQKQLFIARDRLGKKPLYYSSAVDGLYFSSEINALYNVPEIKRELDYVALDHFLTFSYIPSPLSIFKGIRKLPPACFLTLKDGDLEVKKYWQLSFKPKYDISFEEAKSSLLEKIAEATRIRLCSDVPLGCFLSGGVDSSTIVAMMSQYSSTPVKTFSIGFKEGEYNETQYARTVAEKFDTEHHEFIVEPDAIEILPDLVKHYGEPYGDSSALPTWYLSKMTREYVTVALNGDGGDELYAGYDWYRTAQKLCSIKKIVPHFFFHVMGKICSHESGSRVGSRFRKLYRFLELINKENSSRFADLRSYVSIKTKGSLYHQNFLAKLKGETESYISNMYESADCESELDRMMYTDSITYLPEELLVKVDRATMAHSLEGRSPFLDHELMEFVARLPCTFKYRNGQSKYILKETMKEYFSPGFLNRPKMGFSVPLNKWFKGKLRGHVENSICNGTLGGTGLFNMDEIKKICNEHFSGKKNYETTIWNLLILSKWIEMYL